MTLLSKDSCNYEPLQLFLGPMIWTFAGRRHSTLFALFCVIYVPRQLEADNEIRGNVEASSNSSLPELQQLGEKECDNCDESGRERFSSDGNDFSSEGGDDEQIIMTAVVSLSQRFSKCC